MTTEITDEKESSPHEWARPTFGNTDMGSLFDQIRTGLDKYNKNQRTSSTSDGNHNHNRVRGRNRFSSQFTGLRKAAVAKTKAESQSACLALLSGGTISAAAAAATASSSASSTANKDPDADKPILFGSQLMKKKNRRSMFDTGDDGVCKPPLMSAGSLSAYNALYRLPKLLPAPSPMKFDPPRFTFGASNGKNNSSISAASSSSVAASRPLRKSVTPVWLGGDEESSSSTSSADKASSSQPQHQASRDRAQSSSFTSLFKTSSASTKSHTGKRKNLDIICNSTSSSSSNHTTVTPSGALESRGSASIYFNPNDYGNMMNSSSSSSSNVYPESSYGGGFGGNCKYTQEEVDGLIAFADKWIPTPKKRRVGDKEDCEGGGMHMRGREHLG